MNNVLSLSVVMLLCMVALTGCVRSGETFERSSLAPQDRAIVEPPLTFGKNYSVMQPAPDVIYRAGAFAETGGYEWYSVHGYDPEVHAYIQSLADLPSIDEYVAAALGNEIQTAKPVVVHKSTPITNRPDVTRLELIGAVQAVEPAPAITIEKKVPGARGVETVVYPPNYQREQGVAP